METASFFSTIGLSIVRIDGVFAPAAGSRKARGPLPSPIVVGPPTVPLPPSVPLATVTAPLPVPEPIGLSLATECNTLSKLIV